MLYPFDRLSPSKWTGRTAICKLLCEAWENFVGERVLESAPIRTFAFEGWQAARDRGVDPFLKQAPLDAATAELSRALSNRRSVAVRTLPSNAFWEGFGAAWN